MTIFGAPLHELTLEHLRTFMASAEDEPLLWEAKGTNITAGHVRKQVCGFANAHEGGYLILGADRPVAGQAWTVPGHAFDGEATTWISNIIRQEGVRPVPVYDTRVIRVDESRVLTVTRVEPISTPPCNARGTVYERVSGETISVRDPQRLADLFARGDRARAGAEQRGKAAADTALVLGQRDFTGLSGDHVQVAVGMASTGMPPDIAARLFTTDYKQHLQDVLEERFPRDMVGTWPLNSEVSQTAMSTSRVTAHRLGQSVILRATWNGSVGAYIGIRVEQSAPTVVMERSVSPAIDACRTLLQTLGGFGDAHMTILVTARPIHAGQTQGDELVRMSRGPVLFETVSDHVDSLLRELERSTGAEAYEG